MANYSRRNGLRSSGQTGKTRVLRIFEMLYFIGKAAGNLSRHTSRPESRADDHVERRSQPLWYPLNS